RPRRAGAARGVAARALAVEARVVMTVGGGVDCVAARGGAAGAIAAAAAGAGAIAAASAVAGAASIAGVGHARVVPRRRHRYLPDLTSGQRQESYDEHAHGAGG